MADCSYFRCVQERRFIKRELQKWYKNMVYIVGLERVAEELMGRRKWKQYQDSLTQSHASDLLEKQSPSIEQQETSNNNNKQQQQNSENNKTGIKTETLDIKEENKLMTTEDVSEKLDNNKDEVIEAESCESKEQIQQIKSKPSLSSSSSSTEIEETKPLRSDPVDWKPQEKCYFCVDGKLLKVNEIGEIVVETGPVQPEAELNKHIIESDDSSSSSDTIQKTNNQSLLHHQQQQQQFSAPILQKNLETFIKTIGFNSKMTSLESMAAQIAAFQRLQQAPELNQLNAFYPNLFYQFPQVSPTTTPDRSSPAIKTPTSSIEIPSPSPTHQTSGDLPLDLSAKPSGSTSIDSKNIFKAKPRVSTVPGRRSYTEEELNSALQDILSGKLGTRRAAVLYGIPRSTLRNKVYKLAIEQKRELLANHPPIAVLEDEDEKDSGGEEEKEQAAKIGNSNDQLQNYLKLLAKSSESLKIDQSQKDQTSPMNLPNSWPIDPASWLQSLILANGLQGIGGFPSLMQQTNAASSSSSSASKEELPEFLRKLLTQPQDMKQHLDGDNKDGSSSVRNGGIDPLMMMNILQQQQQNTNQPRSSHTPDMDMNDGSDDSSTILKIPSIPKVSMYNQQQQMSASSSKNGDIAHSTSTSTSTPSTSPQMSALSISPQLQVGGSSHLTLRSPSSLLQQHHHQRSDSQSPPSAKFNLHDVIRKSIREGFQANLDPKHSTPLSIEMDKRPTISVIKNLGGTDISRFGTNPNITTLQQQQLSPNNTGTGGKGTRPKRGKYRNYDRDSLVEAVKAVQRGEMSVHRAGSYYGVPHSTLEYKVKERHLMRPRKREPKPQPPLDATTSSSSAASSTTAASIKRQEIQTIDKSKSIANTKAPLKPFTSPNGMKIPPFIDHASMAAQLQLQSQLLWPHPSPFPGLSALDFARSSSQNNSSPFPPNAAENFFAQQMLQKFQEEQQQQQQQQFKSSVNGSGGSNANNSKPVVRDLENLYDPVSTNGSFLDGIIRSTLDKKPADISHGTLFEHLLKKNSLSNSGSSDEFTSSSSKRPGSPMNYTHDIKKERTSPSPAADNDSDYSMHEPQSQSKLRDNMLIKEELNGSLHNNDDVNS